MVSACFFHFAQRRMKLIGWEDIRNLDRLQRSDAARRCLSQTAVKQLRRADNLSTASKRHV